MHFNTNKALNIILIIVAFFAAIIINFVITPHVDILLTRIIIYLLIADFSVLCYFLGKTTQKSKDTNSVQITVSGHSKDFCMKKLIETIEQAQKMGA